MARPGAFSASSSSVAVPRIVSSCVPEENRLPRIARVAAWAAVTTASADNVTEPASSRPAQLSGSPSWLLQNSMFAAVSTTAMRSGRPVKLGRSDSSVASAAVRLAVPCSRVIPISIVSVPSRSSRFPAVSLTISIRPSRLKFGRSRRVMNCATETRLLPARWIAVAIAAVPWSRVASRAAPSLMIRS